MLASLGAKTLADVLALPVIRAPRLVAAELGLLFEDMSVEFPGELIVERPVAEHQATGDVAARWKTIAAFLADNKPGMLETFLPPATATTIAAAETALGRSLPADYKQFLLLCNGQEPSSPMVGTCSLHRVERLADEYKELSSVFDEEDEVNRDLVAPGVRPLNFSAGWIPIGRSARGRDSLCLDMDPAEGGRPGQVIKVAVNFDDRPVVAPTFADLLSLFFEGVQIGEIVLD